MPIGTRPIVGLVPDVEQVARLLRHLGRRTEVARRPGELETVAARIVEVDREKEPMIRGSEDFESLVLEFSLGSQETRRIFDLERNVLYPVVHLGVLHGAGRARNLEERDRRTIFEFE